MDPGGAGFDHSLHQLERVERATETRLRVGEDGREPVTSGVSVRAAVSLPPLHRLRMLDLIRAKERLVDAADDAGDAVRRVEALVGIGLPGKIGVGRDLPAAQVDRVEPRLHLLHRLVSGQRPQRRDVFFRGQEVPEPERPKPRERVLDAHRAAEPRDILLGVRPRNAVPSALRCRPGLHGAAVRILLFRNGSVPGLSPCARCQHAGFSSGWGDLVRAHRDCS